MKKYMLLVVSLMILFSACQTKSDEILIGGAISLTGDNALQGNRGFNGMLLAIDMVNENGGINGKNVKMVAEDTKTTAKGVIDATNKLIRINNVAGIITTGDIEFQAVNDITKKEQIVTLATICSGMLEKDRSPYLFRYCFNEKIQDSILMHFISHELRENEVALLYPNNMWGREIEQYTEAGAKSAGITINIKETYDPNSLDQKAVATKINKLNPRIICARGFGSGFEAVLRYLSELGFKGIVVGDITISLPGTINNTKGIIEGAYYVSVDLKSGDNFTNQYKELYAKKYKEEPSVWDALGFDACMYMIEAIKAAENKKQPLVEAMFNVENIKLLLGKNKFELSNDVIFEMSIFKIIEGKGVFIQ